MEAEDRFWVKRRVRDWDAILQSESDSPCEGRSPKEGASVD